MLHRRTHGRRFVFLALVASAALALAGVPSLDAHAAPATVASSAATDLASIARAVEHGSSLRIEDTGLDGMAAPAALDLVRFEPLAARAKLFVQTGSGAVAAHPEIPAYFRGSVDGLRGSIVVLSVRATGEIRGVVSAADGTWTLSRRAAASSFSTGRSAERLRSRRTDGLASVDSRDFACDVVDNPTPVRSARAAAPARAFRLPIAYTANIAVELDYDYYQLFAHDADAAFLYALDLMAFTGTLGESELGMNVEVPFLLLWTTASDPYSSSTLTRLTQLRMRWNQTGATNCGGYDCTAIDRSTVVLLSAATNGGVAYLPALCDSYHSTNGYSYAFVGGIGGTFDIDSPSAVWDILATTHELGHNFGSHHTHCYNPPIDGCYGGEANCFAGFNSLPSGCPGGGQGCGTIMSYCHLLGGGMGNITLTYGIGHPYGDSPERVNSVIAARLATEFAAAPACLTPTGGLRELAIEKTGTGHGTVTSSPPGIDCGSACRTYFEADSVVTLTPTPSEFSAFAGWSGDPDCADGSVTLSTAASCVATFNGDCGAGNEDCDDGNVCTVDSCVADDHCEHAGTPRDVGACFAAGSVRIKISNSADASKDRLSWQWSAGEAFVQADLGDPGSTTDYTVCVYDSIDGVSSLATSLSLPGGGLFWKNNSPGGWSWSSSQALQDGIRKLQIKTGVSGKTKVKLAASGSALPLPLPVSASALFDQEPEVVIQLVTSGGNCWTSTFDAGATSTNTPEAFKAAGN